MNREENVDNDEARLSTDPAAVRASPLSSGRAPTVWPDPRGARAPGCR